MSENALWAGWQVYRERRSAAVDADRTRRRTVLSGTVAVAVGAVAVVAQVLWQWSGSATVWFLVSVPAIALAAGGMTAFCVPGPAGGTAPQGTCRVAGDRTHRRVLLASSTRGRTR